MKTHKSEKRFWNRKKFKRVEEILQQEFEDMYTKRGMCHQIWARKKQLLKEMYNINWQSPAELNPDIIFE